MEIKKLTLGSLLTNTYIVRKDKEVLIIDPGSEFEVIKQYINEDDKVLAILLTHGHFDHIGAVNDVVQEYFCDIYASSKEQALIDDPSKSFYDGVINYDIIHLDKTLSLGAFDIIVHETPGHTKGGVTFEIEDVLFTGDTVVNLNVGRMDFPTGSESDMYNSIQFFKQFEKDYKIYPGHGNDSTLFTQIERNPYFK